MIRKEVEAKVIATTVSFKKTAALAFLIPILAWVMPAGNVFAQGQDVPFPTYGSGAIQVRIFSDYFCPPCRAIEPALEPLLKDLIKNHIIRVTFVDVPFSSNTPLFAGYFLHALHAKNDFDHALRVRNILFEAATDKSISTKETIEELFNRKKIPYTIFDTKPAFERFNVLIREDNINTTPTCVIVEGGKKKHFIGRKDIVKALEQLQ